MRSGSLAAELGPGSPTESRTGELTGPASMIRPDTFTPSLGRTTMAALPCWGTRVAKPWPSTTVSGRLTTIGSVKVVDAGREDEVLAQSQGRC